MVKIKLFPELERVVGQDGLPVEYYERVKSVISWCRNNLKPVDWDYYGYTDKELCTLVLYDTNDVIMFKLAHNAAYVD